MPKTLFCFICKTAVEVQDGRAIAKLCSDHDNEENRKLMIETPTRQLLAIQDEGLQILLNENKSATESDIKKLVAAIEDIKAQIAVLPAETTIIKEVEKQADNTMPSGTVNEWGEVV